MEDRIEQTITINAAVSRVWELITEPGWWVPSDLPVAVDPAPGRQVVRESEKWGRFVVEVVRLEPNTYAAYRWASAFPGLEIEPGRTTLVEFFLTEQDGGVEVRLVESGFAGLDLPDEARGSAWHGNTEGWRDELASLATKAEAP
jgi:uncharacterized protein YndB with AHSA1/START domain